MNLRTLLFFCFLSLATSALAQESPNFVTYDSHLEDKGDLEVSTQSTIGLPKDGTSTYWAPLLEFEYGAKDWWTTSLYLEGAGRGNDATVFTGFRWENRFRPLKREHWINPVLYFEFEDINEASRIQKEVLGHAGPSDESLSELRGEKAREVEAKLILSSKVKRWTVAGNFMVEKNLSAEEAFEFGYAVGAYRPLAASSSRRLCRFCRESLSAGLEVYGGLGTLDKFGFRDTAQYIAPGIRWQLTPSSAVTVAPSFGFTRGSDRMLLRVGYSFEVEDFGPKIAKLLRK